MIEAEWREAIVAEAKTWLGTPWHHAERVKGAGVDCGSFVVAVYVEVGLLSWESFMPDSKNLPQYPPDFALHRGEERFLEGMSLFADPVDRPLPGDIAAWRFGRCFSHAAIVIEWPRIIHAYIPQRAVVWGDAERDGPLLHRVARGGEAVPRERLFYSHLARAARTGALGGVNR